MCKDAAKMILCSGKVFDWIKKNAISNRITNYFIFFAERKTTDHETEYYESTVWQL